MTDGSQTEVTLAKAFLRVGKEGMEVDPLRQLLGKEKAPKAARVVADHWFSISKQAKGFLRGDRDWPPNFPTPKRVGFQAALAAHLVRHEAVDDRFTFARSLILRVAEAAHDPKAAKTTPRKAVDAVAQYWMTAEALESLRQFDIAELGDQKANLLIKLVRKAYQHFTKGKSKENIGQVREMLTAWIHQIQQHRKGLVECDTLLTLLEGHPTPSLQQEADDPVEKSHSATPRRAAQAPNSPTTDLKAYREAHRTVGQALDQIKEQADFIIRLQNEVTTTSDERDATAKELKQLREIAADHERVLASARQEAEQADQRRLDVVKQLDALMEERDGLQKQTSQLKDQLDEATSAEKRVSEALENAKAGSRGDVVHAVKTGKEELATALAGKLSDRFKQIDEFLALEPSADQIEALRDQVRDLKNSLRASGVKIGG